jgi:hypothetical protein
MHVGRKAAVIAVKSRRGIPLHWNERCQDKSKFDFDATSRIRNLRRKARNIVNRQLREFKGDWEDFSPLILKNEYFD